MGSYAYKDPRAAFAEAEGRILRAARRGAKNLDLNDLGLTVLPESLGQLTQLQTLDLSGNRLRSVPRSFGRLVQLKKLYFHNNWLWSIPKSLSRLTQLQELYLDNNRLKSIAESLTQLTQLQMLFLSGNQLTSVPESFARLTQLQVLSLHSNQFMVVPQVLGQLTELRELYLHKNRLTSIPEAFDQLTQLRELYLYDNLLSSFPESLCRLPRLQKLSLYRNPLSSVPGAICQLTNLRELYLYDNKLESVPRNIGQLNQLRKLHLSSNRLTSIPDTLSRLTQLQELRLSDNQLTSVPGTLGQLSQLQAIDFSGNQLTSMPESLGQLTQLQVLDLSNNQLTSMPESLGQLVQLQTLDLFDNQLRSIPLSLGRLTQLQRLNLSGNQLTSMPESLGQLARLQTLDLSGNQLTSMPESLGQLTQLQTLYLLNNQLTSVPQSLDGLTQLRRFYLSGNQLTSVPGSLGQLIRLETLDLSDNRIMTLPESLRSLTVLEGLYLQGNDALGLPAEALGPTLQQIVVKNVKSAKPGDILDYYFRICAGRRPLNEAKLILVGRGGVGKTSLVNRLLFDRFDKDEKKTEGIRISEWKLRLHGREEVRLNLWDFGGQEIMHATHQFFLTQRSLYLLVLEGRQGAEDADAEYWLKLIGSLGSETGGEVSPVLVVLNKIKENPFDLNRRALQQKYPFIHGFIATDCEVLIGIDELRTSIERETGQLKHLRDAFPAAWFAIKDKLAGMKEKLNRNFISFDEYRRVCAENDENDPQAQEALAFYLHSLGIALNYKDDPRLRDMNVLNPHWVTNGIYKVLNSPRLADQKGETRLDDVTTMLGAGEYPRHMHRFLFDLMKKFELCFTFPDDDAHYLIPELLQKEEAVEAAEFKPAECLNFEYRYPVLPEGLLPRFIVRTHALSTGQPRWRTGVVLAFEGNRALVKADVQDKRVSIAVAGPVAGRRRLLAVIRSDLERIHADIHQLKPEALVPVPGKLKLAVRYSKLLALEGKGKRRFDEELDGELIELDVQELLNGVDLEGTRMREEIRAEQPVRLFYSYSHKDETLRNQLETHLKILERRKLIAPWNDRKIMAGEKWVDKIDENLERADIILLLVSADFIASNYCWEKEMTRALERDAAREAKVVPVILRDVNWVGAPFANLQALPEGGKAVELWDNRDSAWRSVSEGIEGVVQQIRAEGH